MNRNIKDNRSGSQWTDFSLPSPHRMPPPAFKKKKHNSLYEKQKEILQRQSDLINMKIRDFITKVKSDSTKLNAWQGP